MTKSTITLTAKARELHGRKVKSLRREGLIPANVFGKDVKSVSIQVPLADFSKTFKLAGETNIIELSIEGDKKPRPVLISNLQVHPVTNAPIHIDFHQVDLTKKVTATVPVELVGEAPAVKEKGGVLINSTSELDVEALPADIPDSLKLEISSLAEFGDSLTIKDIKVDTSKVTIVASEEETLVLIQEPKEEEEPEPVEEEEDGEAEAEGEGEEKSDEEKPDSSDEKDKDKPEEKSEEPKDKKEE